MRRFSKLIVCLGAGLMAAGCPKGKTDYSQGRKAEHLQDYDAAYDFYQRALKSEPENAEYQIRFNQARFEAGALHVKQGVKLQEALDFLRQIAAGLGAVHAIGVTHRDMKPANLLFDEHGVVRVADFGLARALAEASWTEPFGALVGTARYAAPEQSGAVPVDGRADLYALAVVLVEACTGEVPVVGVNKFRTVGEAHVEPEMEITSASPEAARDAAQRVGRVRRERDAGKAQAALHALAAAAGGKDNLQPHIREAVRAYCTVGEIASALKKQFGVYQPPTRF